MPTFNIDGASRATGAPVRLTLSAQTVSDVERQAADMGVLIARISADSEPAPASATVRGKHRREPVQIENTAKSIKRRMAGGVALMLIGLSLALLAHAATGFVMASLGAVVYVTARASAWWRHG